jgi:CheY-like chemotaxis protein
MSTPEVSKKISRGTVIVLEDAEPARNIVKFFLEKNGFTVHGFANGRQALDYIEKEEIVNLKLIMSDIMMPEMDGFEFVKSIKELNKFDGVPIIIMSAMTEKDSILEAKRLKVAGYMVKPITINKLIETLKKILPNEKFKDFSTIKY